MFKIRKHKRNYGKKEYYYFGSACLFCRRERNNKYKAKNCDLLNKKAKEYRKNNLEKVKKQEFIGLSQE